MMNRSPLLLLCPALITCLIATQRSDAKHPQEKGRAASVKLLMSGLIAPQSKAIGAALKEEPSDDKAWATIANNAALLNEISYNLMQDERCPDDEWEKAVKTLRDSSAEVAAKAKAKDAAGANKAFSTMTSACKNCHKAHKD